MKSLEHAKVPAEVFETQIQWIQPTPAHYDCVTPVPVIEILEESVKEEDPMEEKGPAEPALEAVPEPGIGRIIESDESSHRWMCEPIPHYPWKPAMELTPSPIIVESSLSSDYIVVPDLDRAGPSGIARVVVSSDTSLEDPDNPYSPGTLSGGGSQ